MRHPIALATKTWKRQALILLQLIDIISRTMRLAIALATKTWKCEALSATTSFYMWK